MAAQPKAVPISNLLREANHKVDQIVSPASPSTAAMPEPELKPNPSNGQKLVAEECTLRDFTTPDQLSNLILRVEDKDLYVHKEVLASWSPVFMTMFTTNFRESETNVIPLHGKKLDSILLLLNLIYPPNTHSVTAENVMRILPLASEYSMETVKAKCEVILLDFEPTPTLLSVAHLYDMPGLLNKTLKSCATLPFPTIDFQNQQQSLAIPEGLLPQVYREKILMLTEELTMLTKVTKELREEKDSWLKQKGEVLQWSGAGIHRANQACERHRKLNESCDRCLHAFREHTLAVLRQDTTQNYSVKKRKFI